MSLSIVGVSILDALPGWLRCFSGNLKIHFGILVRKFFTDHVIGEQSISGELFRIRGSGIPSGHRHNHRPSSDSFSGFCRCVIGPVDDFRGTLRAGISGSGIRVKKDDACGNRFPLKSHFSTHLIESHSIPRRRTPCQATDKKNPFQTMTLHN